MEVDALEASNNDELFLHLSAWIGRDGLGRRAAAAGATRSSVCHMFQQFKFTARRKSSSVFLRLKRLEEIYRRASRSPSLCPSKESDKRLHAVEALKL